MSDEDFDEVNKEISIHIKIQNEFIIEYIDHFFESNYPCIVTVFYKVSSKFLKTIYLSKYYVLFMQMRLKMLALE